MSAAEKINARLPGERGHMILAEAEAAALPVPLACALVEKESGGRNIFGFDWGVQFADEVPFAHLPVTKERVAALLAAVAEHGYSWSNGVGLTQLTWPPTIRAAELAGGAHKPRIQCRIGFLVLSDSVARLGYLKGLSAYNSGVGKVNDYGRDLAKRHAAWHEYLEEEA
jgi:hypothetical protein